MIASPITRRDADNLSYSNDGHLLGCILRRLVFAGAKQDASAILDELSQPLEQYMTSEKCLDMGYPDKLGWDWMNIRDTYYTTLVF